MIHGLFYKTTKYRHQDTLIRGTHPVLNIAPAHQQINTWSNDHCWLAEAVDKGQVTSLEQHEQTVITAWARIDNRVELVKKLGLSTNELVRLSDKQLILRAYLQYGEECTQHLFGDFCFVIYDPREEKFFCARDQMGCKPFYYYNDEHVFAFSSSLALFHELECVNVRPSMEWACKFLVANLSMDFHKTPYHQIFKLPPAEQMSVGFDRFVKHRYFSFHTQKIALNSSEAYVELYRSMLEQAVKSRVQTPHSLGSEISGGLDSSTVTAYAATYYPQPMKNFFTFGFARLANEPQCILQVNQRYKIANSFICSGLQFDENIHERAFSTLGAPVEHGNATAHHIFYEIGEKHQVRTLLSGFGGDEFVTSIHGDLYLYELLNNRKLFTLYQTLHGNAITRALRLAKLAYKRDKNGGKVSTFMRHAYDSRWPHVIVADELIDRYSLKKIYDDVGKFDNGYNELDKFTLEKRWAPFVSTRMENCTLMAASYGIDYRWPLLDTRLIQCFLSIPSSEKIHRGMGRYLHRRAIADKVPKDIVWQASKYMGPSIHENITQPTLNDDLHVDLLPLLNIKKLNHQMGLHPKMKEEQFQTNQNINHINQLDRWLKYHFAKGCDWANTPDETR